MGQIDWNTPPTESEVLAGFDTPPTESEMNFQGQQAPLANSYEGIETFGMQYPQRDIMDVITGRGTTPQEKQQQAFDAYQNQSIQGGQSPAMESVTPFADTFNPIMVGAKVLGGIGAGYGAYKGTQALKNKIFPIGGEAEAVGGFRALSPNQIETMTEGVPREDKAFSLAMGGGTDTVGVVEAAVKSGGDKAARALKVDLGKRKAKIEEAINANDMKEVSKETSHMYSQMVKIVAKGNKVSYDGTSLLDGLNKLEKLGARSDASERTVNVLKNKLEENSNITIEQALDYRKDINYELRTAKGDSVAIWQGLKDNVDEFIKTNTDPKLHSFIDDAVDTYATTKNNEELVSIINRSTTSDGNAIDWDKAYNSIVDAGLNSPETEKAMNITKEFAEKFGNDSKLSKLTVTKGSPESANGVFTLFSKAVKTVVNLGEKALRTDSAINREVQANILSSIIKKSNTENEFMANVIKNKYVPKEIRDKLAEHLKKTKNLHKTPYGEVAKETVNKDIERNLRKSQRDRNQAQNTMDKAQDRVNSLDDEIMDLELKIERAIENQKPTGKLRERKAVAETRLERAERDLVIKSDKHSEVSDRFDKELSNSGYEIDEMGKFTFPSKAEPRSKVNVPEKDLP